MHTHSGAAGPARFRRSVVAAWAVALSSLAAAPSLPAAQSEVIGTPANGCLAGAEALPRSGIGYEVLRPSRLRYFGHPDLIRFVGEFGRAVKAAALPPVLIGDLAQPYGGPMSFGHASHQSGIDVDVWFRSAPARLSDAEREQPTPVSMVSGRNTSAAWSADKAALVRLAASRPEVERIFVNPVIKQSLCRSAGAERAWLRKVRPWWGHDEHFHVRLVCPAGSADCVPQAPLPPGDGCGAEVESWLKQVGKPTRKPTRPVVREPKEPPERCRQLMAEVEARGSALLHAADSEPPAGHPMTP